MPDIRIVPGNAIMSFTSSLNFIERITQDPSGSLNLYGSGSTGRTELLSIDGNNGRLFTVSDDLSDSLFSVNTIAGLPVIEAFANNTVVLGQYGQNVLVVTGSRVGIGTSSPYSPLQVGNYTGTGGYSYGLAATFVSSFNSSFPTLFLGTTDTTSTQNKGGSIAFGGGSEASSTPYTFAQIKGLKEVTGGGYSGYMAFYTTPAGSDANTERMRINSSGNVGIGTTSPTRRLDVAGLSMFNGTQVRSTDDGSTLVGFFGNRSGWTGGSLSNELTIGAYTGNICFFTNNDVTERMRITSTGNVGIGTTTPGTLLTVSGNQRLVTGTTQGLFAFDAPSGGSFIWSLTRYTDTNANDLNVNALSGFAVRTGVGSLTNSGHQFYITSAGNVGIGTTSPVRNLQVGGFSGNPEICIGSGTSGNGTLAFGDGASGNDPWRGFVQYQHATDRMVFGTANAGWLTLTPGGALGLNIVPTNTAGRFEASNDIVAFSTSDKRWKNNIVNIDSPLEKISQINGVEFDWIEDEPLHGNKGHDVGVIAQEIELILPEAVQTRESGMKAVQYDKIIPLLIECIKDQQKQIEELKQIVNGITK